MDTQQLKTWRKSQTLTQAQLGVWLGMQGNTIARWESGLLPVPYWLPLALETIERRLKRQKKEAQQ